MKMLWRGLIILLLLLNLFVYAWRSGWLENFLPTENPPSLSGHNALPSSTINNETTNKVTVLKIGETPPQNLDLLLYGQTTAIKKMLNQKSFQQQLLCVRNSPQKDVSALPSNKDVLDRWYSLIANIDAKNVPSVLKNEALYLLLLDTQSNYPPALWQALGYANILATRSSLEMKEDRQYHTLWFNDVVHATQAVKLLARWHVQQQQEKIIYVPFPPLKPGAQLIYRHQAHALIEWLERHPPWNPILSCVS